MNIEQTLISPYLVLKYTVANAEINKMMKSNILIEY